MRRIHWVSLLPAAPTNGSPRPASSSPAPPPPPAGRRRPCSGGAASSSREQLPVEGQPAPDRDPFLRREGKIPDLAVGEEDPHLVVVRLEPDVGAGHGVGDDRVQVFFPHFPDGVLLDVSRLPRAPAPPAAPLVPAE